MLLLVTLDLVTDEDEHLRVGAPALVVGNDVQLVQHLLINTDGYTLDSHKNTPKQIICAFTLCLFCVNMCISGIFHIYFMPKFFGSTGAEIKCPNFVGKSYEAINSDNALNSQFKIVFDWDYSSEYPYGTIFEQSQVEGKNLKKGATIVLYVSTGTETKSVPEVKNSTLNNAKKTLEMQGFVVKVVEKADEEVAAGLVVGTNPAAGSSIADGSEIILYVSSGAPTVYVSLPDVTKMTLETAKNELAKAGLIAGEVTFVDNTDVNTPANVVVSQDPVYSTGKQVGKGTVVNLTVSSGKTKYSSNVSVDIESPATAASLWIDGEMVQELTNLSATQTEVSFTGVSSYNKQVSAIVKIKTANTPEYTEHLVITIDLANKGKVTVTKKTAVN